MRKLILSVDDEAGILHSRQMMLQASGYDVLNASSGERALGIFSTVLVDLAVLDYSLPGVNGAEVAKVMKARRPELPIIMVSGSQVGIEAHFCVDGFLLKGESPALLLEKIEELLSPTPGAQSPEDDKMNGNGKSERWEDLAARASGEQDPDKLLTLVDEIDRLLEGENGHSNDGAFHRADAETRRLMAQKKSLRDDGPNTTDSK
jgi:DNA-binding response OmpR family regulator